MIQLSFNPYPTIETERLLLRQVRPRDAPEIFFLRSDHEMLKYLGMEPMKSHDEASTLIDKFDTLQKNNEAINWGIALKENNAIIGTICIWNIDKEQSSGELGYMLHTAHQGKGIMQEALGLVIDYGFEAMRLRELLACTSGDNSPSLNLLTRNSFRRNIEHEEKLSDKEKELGMVVYSLLNLNTENHG